MVGLFSVVVGVECLVKGWNFYFSLVRVRVRFFFFGGVLIF